MTRKGRRCKVVEPACVKLLPVTTNLLFLRAGRLHRYLRETRRGALGHFPAVKRNQRSEEEGRVRGYI